MMSPELDGLMGDVYQRIWTADISLGAGLRAIKPSESRNQTEGYVIVNEGMDTSNPGELFPGEPIIPPSKSRSYALARALFDNYNFLKGVQETTSPEEIAEIDQLLTYSMSTPPMLIARQYLGELRERPYSELEWYTLLNEMWFRPFQSGRSSPYRSGFEHVFLSERSGTKIGGLHWWYYYAALESQFEYRGAKYGAGSGGSMIPEIVTMRFAMNVDGNTLLKPTGSFFVGPSVEGLMALGTVRAAENSPTTAEIEGFRVDLKMFKSPDGRSVNTFYPVLKSKILTSVPDPPFQPDSPTPTENTPSEKGDVVRLVAAFTNPSGPDQGRESVTLMNMKGPAVVQLDGWTVIGPRGGELIIGGTSLQPGMARTFVLTSRGGIASSNKGGTISLRAPNGEIVQTVEYPGGVAQGEALVWNGGSRLVSAGNP